MNGFITHGWYEGNAWRTPLSVCIHVGLARTIYIRFTYGIFGLEITKYTVYIYVYIRFWPTLHTHINRGNTVSAAGDTTCGTSAKSSCLWCTHEYAHTCTRTCTHAHVHAHVHTDIHTCTHMYTQIYTQIYTHVHTDIHTDIHICTHITQIYTCKHTCTHTCTHRYTHTCTHRYRHMKRMHAYWYGEATQQATHQE